VTQQAWRSDEPGRPQLLAEGKIRIGCVALETFKPCRIPSAIFDSIR
jgi:acyl-CoA thioesterase FadM